MKLKMNDVMTREAYECLTAEERRAQLKVEQAKECKRRLRSRRDSVARKTEKAKSGCWSIRAAIKCRAPICSTGRGIITGSLSRKRQRTSETSLRVASHEAFKKSRRVCADRRLARGQYIIIRIGDCCPCLSRPRIGANQTTLINEIP